MTAPPADLEREMLELRAKNAELQAQVTDLVRVSTRMHRLRATLEDRQRLYRSLAHFLGEELPAAPDCDEVAHIATTFVGYELGFERVVLVASCLERVHHMGFWDDEGRPQRVLTSRQPPLPQDVRVAIHSESQPHVVLGRFAAMLGLVELGYLPLVASDGSSMGWMAFGSSMDGSVTSARLTGQDADQIHVARSVSSAVAVAMENRLQARDMEVAVERAEAASQAKSRFVANMTHELRTPLNAIVGYTELVSEVLEERGHLGELEHDLGRVLNASRRLLFLVDDVLDLARVESGNLRIRPERFCVRRLLDQVVEEVTPAAIANRNQLGHDLMTVDPDPWMVSDPARVRQVLANLLANAIKFTEDGVVTVSAEVRGREVIFEVADTGIGMSTEALERIFQPFEQVDNSSTRRFGGTGLGLHITKQLVELLGGRIEAFSEPGWGSLFKAVLPRTLQVGQAGAAQRGGGG